MNEEQLKAFMLPCMTLLLEANKRGNSRVEIDFNPAKSFGVKMPGGQFRVVIAAGESMNDMDSADALKSKLQNVILVRLQQLQNEPIQALREAKLAAIEGQAELGASLGILLLEESEAIIVHARNVCAGREKAMSQEVDNGGLH